MKIEVPLCWLQTFVLQDARAHWGATWWGERIARVQVFDSNLLVSVLSDFTSLGLIITISILLKRKEGHQEAEEIRCCKGIGFI